MNKNLHRLACALRHTCRTWTRDVRRKTFKPTSVERHYGSALFVPGNKASKTFAFLYPYLDFDRRFADADKLQKELTLRGMNVDVAQLQKSWNFYVRIIADKYALEDSVTELVNRKNSLPTDGELTVEQQREMQKLNTQIQIVRQDLKTIKEAIWEIEEDVMGKLLKLPTDLDPRTPVGESVVLRSVGDVSELSEQMRRDHIDVGTSLKLLDYTNPIHYYLCDDAALFELAVLGHAGRVFGEKDMIRVSGTDFSRSFVVEAAGLNHEDPATAFLLHHNEVEANTSNRMHLVGGASLISFLALHTKQRINPKYFPLKYFATGRRYTPLPRDSSDQGLFAVCQASVAQVFAMVKDATSDEYRATFEELVETVCGLYDDLCVHYRVIMRSASELQPWEGLRVSFEMWSPYAKRYYEIGHLSASGDYFSKRLLIVYQTPTGTDFPAAISGTVLSVPRLLACLFEQNPREFVIPPKIAELMPSN
ncbi:serine--tRNA synthetase-like protein Slimp [Pseudomyrmex gracilis]|uniref:serine--tRNA synthetase-like protein Slimp n=1 Tax=Pseudomyrmex gracilis TaxID=219809 RepID=UPI000995B781|nr:serine--tRNA synthetase-like protein Slimp [Pseudomyrmex gracilis]